MKKWLKSLSKEQIQRYVFIGLLVLVFVAFFVSLTIANESVEDPSNDPIENPGNNDNNNDNNNNNNNDNNNDNNITEKPDAPKQEKMGMPLKEDFVVVRKYYDSEASVEEQELAVIQFGKRYYTSNGISLSTKDNKEFEVLAALSGEVVSVDESPIYGVVITIKHQSELYTEYSSLSEAKVAKGDLVAQGDVIGVSGVCEYDSNLDSHVYFKVMSGSKTFNPERVIGETIETILK